jgi:tRNA threonylcarbamoyladenosine biosynthesis protein TsaE
MKKLPTLPPYITIDNIPHIAQVVARHLQGGEILGLFGDLGSGKTLFTQHLAKSLKVKKPVTSPTFTLMNHYKGQLPTNKKIIEILHLDLYRTNSSKEVKTLNLLDLWAEPNTITIIEWAEKIKKLLPKNSILLKFKND